MPRGGARPGAGRPRRQDTAEDRARRATELALQRRRLRAANRLFNAQLRLAEGVSYVYEIVETGTGKSKRREHVLVTDPERIRQFLDREANSEGAAAEGENFMYITTERPDNKAIVDIFDRTFGRAAQAIEIDDHRKRDAIRDIPDEQLERELAEIEAAETAAAARAASPQSVN